ncbi:unnamed protein product [Brassica oleracea var. botrytis]|uniref:Phorbol-ester/DAG-type domain-containing protein n=2 Tax=Brassica TaxID=3705 RepID=A0A3P6C175_BRAOL|nr:unnamed protein product [Brassica napus]VDD04545.1 unnamed protein product [Brassica oleracea]
MLPVNECVDLFWHEHRLCYKVGLIGDGCEECHKSTGKLVAWNPLYECSVCKMKWHPSCVPSSPENINHPCHSSHPLELRLLGPPNYADGKCSLCQQYSNFIYHCKLCDFSVDMNCAKNPPPVTVDHPKCHEHGLTIMCRDVSFTCNACGTHGERNPYVCLPCSLMFHYDCIDLPHVININRHDHRVSHSYPLSPRDRVCEVCRQDINWRYGGYSCNKCPDFSVHSLCATRKDVWDGIELEGIEEEYLETVPFKMIKEGVINHLFHQVHNLYLIDGGGEGIQQHCEACAHTVSSEKHYKCMECSDFFLHQRCANLPLRKRHGLSTRMLTLHPGKEKSDQLYDCCACCRYVSGFRYEDGENIVLDVHCASLSWFENLKLHPHALFLTTLDRGTCVACDKTNIYVLSCVDCEYTLDFKCATLPVVIKHRCDDHSLVLCRGGEKVAPPGKYWCTVCEAETNPEKWFYTCNDCGVTCHVDCVIGDSLNIKPGFSFMGHGVKIEAVLNDTNSRPLCSSCGARCRFPIYYTVSSDGPHCSLECITNYMMARVLG